jgi:hypothetical protein
MSTAALDETAKALITFFTAGIGATVVLLMPGYLLRSVYDRNRKGPERSERAFIADSATGSIVVHLALLAWTVQLAGRLIADGPVAHVVEIGLWAVVALVVVPVVFGVVLALVAEIRSPAWLRALLVRSGLSSVARVSQAWDWVFSRGFPAYVRVRLTDGRVVYGVYGEQSFASSESGQRDLYLQQHWVEADDWFAEPYPQSMGVWLSGTLIVSIEFFRGRPAAQGGSGSG